MGYPESFYNSIIHHMFNAFAYHKIITDAHNRPVDFEFIEVNSAFEKLTGLKRENVIGKCVKTVIPDIVNSSFDWINLYGTVALEGICKSFKQYFEGLNKWYYIRVYSPQKGYFVTIFDDISDIVSKDDEINKRSNELMKTYEALRVKEKELLKKIQELELNQDVIKKSKERFQLALEGSNDIIFDWDMLTGKIYITDRHLEDGQSNGSIVERDITQWKEFIYPEDRQIAIKRLKEYFDGEMPTFVCEYRAKASDGNYRWYYVRGKALFDEHGKPYRMAGSHTDITEQRNEHKLLEVSEERYRTLVENIHDPIYSCDINGFFTSANEVFCSFFQVKHEDVIGKVYYTLDESEEDQNAWVRDVERVIKKGKTVKLEKAFVGPDDSLHYHNITLSPIYNNDKEIIGFTGIHHDITEIRKNEEMIKRIAYYDPLTDLPNRFLFIDRLNVAIDRAKRAQTKAAVILLDLDNFKKINDIMGHSFGDELIKEVSKKLKSCVRPYDTLARLSGDEFIILIQDIMKFEDIVGFVERVRAVFETPFECQENSLHVSASIGITIYPDDSLDAEELLKNADTALYKAKELFRNNYQFYNKAMKEEVIRKVYMEKHLRDALKNDELKLYYQPLIDTSNGKIRGVEALLRWFNPDLGMIPPNNFIPIAEESGLIIQIGEWVIRTACEQTKEWHSMGFTSMIVSVNISAIQLKQKDFVSLVSKVLAETGLQADYLELEITESVLIDSFEDTISKLEELKKIGVKISLDDFGTGYSSLNYLKLLPLNTLKIDKTFVDDIKSGSIEKVMAGSIISLVHKLELDVVAEGVETIEQLNYLIECKCDNVQGFLLSKPIPGEDVVKILRKGFFDIGKL